MLNQISYKLSMTFLMLALAGLSSVRAAAPEFAKSPNERTLRKSDQTAVIVDKDHVMPITISPEATATVRDAAAQMAGILKKMTGKEFPIQENAQPVGIVLGSLAQFPDKAVTKTLAGFGQIKIVDGVTVPVGKDPEGRPNWKGLDAYAIRTQTDSIRLLGQTETGAVHAASRFLELLGMRRFSPSLAWEIIPKKTTLRFDADEESAPDYYVRDIWFAFGPNPARKPSEEPMTPQDAWKFANKLSDHGQLRTAHMYGVVYRENKEEFDAHKEKYYAEIKGERKVPGKFCLAQPRVREMIVETVINQLAGKDGVRSFMASVEPSDGPYWCECALCVAMGTPSERTAIVAREAAKRAEEVYPGSNMLGRLAYFIHTDPPSFEQPANVLTVLATRMGNGLMAFPDLVEEWPKFSKTIGIYDYFSTFVWGQDRLRDPVSYVPAADPYALAEKLRYFYELGYRYMQAESMPNFALYAPGYLVASDVMWDIKSDEKAIMEDFYDKSFGAAKEPMRQFYELMNPRSGRQRVRETYASLISYLDQATKLASKDPEVLARIDQLKLMIIHNYYQYQIYGLTKTTENPEENKKWSLKMMELVYRTRFDWINHASAWLTSVAKSFAKKFDDPRWNPGNSKNPAIWQQNDTPIGVDELKSLWKEAQDFFGVAPKELLKTLNAQKAETQHLRVITNQNADKPEVTTFSIAGGGGIAKEVYFLSEKGEPLKLHLTLPEKITEVSRTVSVWVTDQDGKRIDRQLIPKDSKEKAVDLEVKLPGPGIYGVAINGVGYPRISPGLDQRFFVTSLGDVTSVPIAPSYFYIPKNIEDVKGYVTGKVTSKPSVLRSADHTDWELEPDEFGYFTVSIPENLRGTIWSTMARNIYFTNIPNLFTKDPGYVVVPDNLKED